MYFLPRNNKAYSFIVHIRPAYRYLLTGLVATLMCYGWHAAIYTRIETVIGHYQTQAAHTQQQQIESKVAKEGLKKLRAEVAVLEGKLAEYTALGASGADRLQATVTTILDYAQHIGLRFVAFTADKEFEKEMFVQSFATFEFTGDYDRIIQFFDLASTSQLLVQYERVELQHISKDFYTLKCTLLLSALA